MSTYLTRYFCFLTSMSMTAKIAGFHERDHRGPCFYPVGGGKPKTAAELGGQELVAMKNCRVVGETLTGCAEKCTVMRLDDLDNPPNCKGRACQSNPTGGGAVCDAPGVRRL